MNVLPSALDKAPREQKCFSYFSFSFFLPEKSQLLIKVITVRDCFETRNRHENIKFDRKEMFDVMAKPLPQDSGEQACRTCSHTSPVCDLRGLRIPICPRRVLG